MLNYIIRKATTSDIGEVVRLMYKATEEVFPDREQSSQIKHEFVIADMLADGVDIVVSELGGEVTGFLIGHKDSFYKLLEPNYLVALVYVEKRNTKASYLLYHWAFKRAKELGMPLETYAVSKDSKAFAKRNQDNIVGYILNFKGN